MRNRLIFIFLILIYTISIIITTFLDLNVDIKDDKRLKREYKLKDIRDYQKDINISNIGINRIWGVAEFQEETESKKELNSTVEKESNIKLRDNNGFYTIIISEKEFNLLGVAQTGKDLFIILYDTNLTKNRDAIKRYYKNDIIYKDTRVQKIYSDYILLVDSKKEIKLKVPYFFVNVEDFKPKDESNDY